MTMPSKRWKAVRPLLGALVAVILSGGCASGSHAGAGRGYIIVTSAGPPAVQPDPSLESRSFFGIRWVGSYLDNLRFARNLDYRYVEYQDGMEDDPQVSDVHFLVENPFYAVYRGLFGTDYVRIGDTVGAVEQERMERFLAWRSTAPFPANLATGWFEGRNFFPQPDFQQQAVIDQFVEAIVQYVKDRDRPQKRFTFAGMTWDVPQLTGDFWSGVAGRGGQQVTLAYWTGADSSVLHEGITHEYATFSDGMAAFYKKLRQRLAQEFAGRPLVFMMEPYRPYQDWISQIEGRADAAELMPDLLFQEGRTLDFVEDGRLFASGLISHDRVGCSTPDEHGFPGNRRLAAAAALHGSWFNWYFRFGGTGDRIDYRNVYDVPAWLQLVRVVPNWDNLAGVPLEQRSFEHDVYRSPNSLVDDHLVATRNPYTGAIFAVFRDRKGVFALRPGESVVSIQRADAWFGPAGDGSADLEVGPDGTIRRR